VRLQPERSSVQISEAEFQQIREFARSSFGLELRPGKETLVLARVSSLLRSAGCTSFRQYFRHVKDDRSGEEITNLINALTTNYTGFFRERPHFDFFRDEIKQRPSERQIRIWSAACSTGEEPYSIACEIFDAVGPAVNPSRFEVLATDISSAALHSAVQGVYKAPVFSNLPDYWKRTYLQKGKDEWAGHYRIRPEIRALVKFGRVNLLHSLSACGSFRFIFCRNVMIYFSRDLQQRVVNKLAAQLEPGGYLFTGHAESLSGLEHPLEYVQPAIYRRPG
jgi:chemotaxis protein methyltransferase CheR